jgi:hypothetical protein
MSTIVTSNVSDGTLSIPTTYVTNGSAKAWLNFNGTGTAAVRDSLNVSSLTDNTTGQFSVNLTNTMANTNAACTSFTHAAGVTWMSSPDSFMVSASVVTFNTANFSGVGTDASHNGLAVYGDLA